MFPSLTRFAPVSRSSGLLPRRLRQISLILTLVSLPVMAQGITPPPGEGFSYEWLKSYARNSANDPYVDHQSEVPDVLKNLTKAQYQSIHYRRDHAIWSQQPSDFRAELFPLGRDFDTPVHLFRLKDGNPIPVDYDPKAFDFGQSGIDGMNLPALLGFAGFRAQFHTDWSRDLVSFLGASYFRATGNNMQYGLSARGLAINSGLPRPEEFPAFTNFWLQDPAPGSDTLTVYAYLDSPSVTGAYRFDIRPGVNLKMKVRAAIYPRAAIDQLGIAPLTSMFLNGENDRRVTRDWRPEVHDSDGLAMHTGNDQWIWRPLANPLRQRVNAYSDENPKGFGLMQRDRNFDHYQDDVANYGKRPSLWVEPNGNWGKGAIQLVEIPTTDESFNNVVAFWKPAQPVLPGQELTFGYTLYWGSQPPVTRDCASVVNTFTGLLPVTVNQNMQGRRFVVDFKGGLLPMLGAKANLKPVITASSGQVKPISVHRLDASHIYRVTFDVIRATDASGPINLHLHLEKDNQSISESWFYQWSLPADVGTPTTP